MTFRDTKNMRTAKKYLRACNGIPKVTGDKVFAVDIRASDMHDWLDDQWYAFFITIQRANRVFRRVTLDPLGVDLQRSLKRRCAQ